MLLNSKSQPAHVSDEAAASQQEQHEQCVGIGQAHSSATDHDASQVSAVNGTTPPETSESNGFHEATVNEANSQSLLANSNDSARQEMQTEIAVPSSTNAAEQHSAKSMEAELGRLPCTPPQKLPALHPNREIPRIDVKDLTAAQFKQQYWKSDTPVIITGAFVTYDNIIRAAQGSICKALLCNASVLHDTALLKIASWLCSKP